MMHESRRGFLKHVSLGAAALATGGLASQVARAADKPGMRFGLVTYQWGQDWDLPTLLKNMAAAKLWGVELRSTHSHGVEPSLNADQRKDVRKRFEDGPVKLVSIGSAQEYHWPDPEALKRSIEATKAFIRLSHDVGSSGVKVRPNDLPRSVAPEKTIEQIGTSLNTVGAFAADYGQQIRLEVHGQCAKLPIIRQIMDIATHPSVTVCWNSNPTDLLPPGLEENFNMVKGRLGLTTHVHQLDAPGYPWAELIKLLVKADYKGWVLLEAGGKPPADRVAALIRQRELFEKYLAEA